MFLSIAAIRMIKERESSGDRVPACSRGDSWLHCSVMSSASGIGETSDRREGPRGGGVAMKGMAIVILSIASAVVYGVLHDQVQ
jgi:hypothetical protein